MCAQLGIVHVTDTGIGHVCTCESCGQRLGKFPTERAAYMNAGMMLDHECEIKLNLGCSSAHHAGYTNVDLVEPADVIADLRHTWPWPDSSVSSILGIDIIEHLPDKVHTMNEMWRVLKPGAIAEIEVPTTNGECAFADPTHVSFWNRRSFFYYDSAHPYRKQYAAAYGIRAEFTVAEEYVRTMRDGPKLLIKLRAVKP